MPPDDKLLQLLETVARVDERTLAMQDSQRESQSLIREWKSDWESKQVALELRVAAIEQVHVEDAAKREALKGRASWFVKLGGVLSAVATALYGVLKAAGVLS